MEKRNNTNKNEYTGKWLRIGIITVAGCMFMYKDVNLQVDMNSIPRHKPIASLSASKISTPTYKQKSVQKKVVRQTQKIASAPRVPLQHASSHDVEAFIKRFSKVAKSEQQKFGIPASIVLANGLLQSGAGQSDFAQQANNFFNIPCDATWNGAIVDIKGICARKYETAWMGFRGHSLYVSQRYPHLKILGSGKYKKWAKGLEAGKYANQQGLAHELIQVIEKYKLYRFDV